MNKKEKIIIVDDEENITNALKMVVEGINYEAVTFNNPDEFLNYLHKNKGEDISFVIMDIMLGTKKSGIDALKEMKTIVDLPSIIITAYADWNIVERDQSFLKDIPLLQKPIELDRLVKTIKLIQKQKNSK